MSKGARVPWKCRKVFCALLVTAKPSVDELFMHYFYNLSSASEDKAPDFRLQALICPTLEKIMLASIFLSVNKAANMRLNKCVRKTRASARKLM